MYHSFVVYLSNFGCAFGTKKRITLLSISIDVYHILNAINNFSADKRSKLTKTAQISRTIIFNGQQKRLPTKKVAERCKQNHWQRLIFIHAATHTNTAHKESVLIPHIFKLYRNYAAAANLKVFYVYLSVDSLCLFSFCGCVSLSFHIHIYGHGQCIQCICVFTLSSTYTSS